MPDSIIDLTHPLTSNIPVYPGDRPFVSTPLLTVPTDGVSVHSLSLGTHTGTHIDAPSHFFLDGKSIGQFPISELIAVPAVVVDLSTLRGDESTIGLIKPRERITWADLKKYEGKMKEGTALVLYTGWSKKWFMAEYFAHPYLTRDAAEEIVARGVKILGVDTLSPDETPPKGDINGDFGVHETVLGKGRLIVENLANVDALLEEGNDVSEEWAISFVPLYLGGAEDGSPVRAFAWRRDSDELSDVSGLHH